MSTGKLTEEEAAAQIREVFSPANLGVAELGTPAVASCTVTFWEQRCYVLVRADRSEFVVTFDQLQRLSEILGTKKIDLRGIYEESLSDVTPGAGLGCTIEVGGMTNVKFRAPRGGLTGVEARAMPGEVKVS